MKRTEMFCHEMDSHTGKTFLTDFFQNPKVVRMCDAGEPKPKPVLRVFVTEDPATPPTQRDTYWGWWEHDKAAFVFVYRHYILLDMCFAYGVKADKNGIAMPVVVEIQEVVMN